MINRLVDLPLILDNSKATAEADQFVEKAAEGSVNAKQDEIWRKEKAAGLDGSAGVVKELDGSAGGAVKGLVSNAICKQCFFHQVGFQPSNGLKNVTSTWSMSGSHFWKLD